MLAVQVARELADRHPVSHGERVEADEGRERRIAHVALDDDATERVWPIEHDDPHAHARAHAHGEGHRPVVGVVARADVLQVDDEHVESAEHRDGRFASLAVEAPHRQSGRRVARAGHQRVILRGAPQSVLRRQERRELYPT